MELIILKNGTGIDKFGIGIVVSYQKY